MFTPSSTLITFCFLVMAIFWVFTAFSNKKTAQKGGGWILRLVFYLSIFLVIYLQNSVNFLGNNVWPKSESLNVLADIVTALGLMIMIWSRITLGKNWSANIVLKEEHRLVTTGPYAYVRHPIYSGLILMVLGVILYVNTLILTVFFIVFFFGAYFKANKEEKILLTIFPIEYAEYKKKVKALIPLIF